MIIQNRNQTSYRSQFPLSDAQIWAHAPSIMASAPHASCGARYSLVSTRDVLDGLREEGFQPFEVRQTHVRDESRRDTTKHLIRLRHESRIGVGVGDEVPEVIVVNSHDGTSSYRIMAGLFRLVCSNGLIAGSLTHDIRVRHSGDVVGDVIEGSYRVLSDIASLEDRVEAYRSITLTRPEQLALATVAMRLRWGDDSPVVPGSLLTPLRWQDNYDDLWTTFNRVQEHIVSGGVRGRSATGRRMTTRGVGGVTENVRINRALWTLADEMAAIKAA